MCSPRSSRATRVMHTPASRSWLPRTRYSLLHMTESPCRMRAVWIRGSSPPPFVPSYLVFSDGSSRCLPWGPRAVARADPSLGLISTFGKVSFPVNIWSIHSATRLREVLVSILHILFVCVAHKSGLFIFIYSFGPFCLFSALHGKPKLTEHPQGNFANIVLFLQLRAHAWPMAGVRWTLLNKLMSENELWEFPLGFQPQIPQIGHPCLGCF